MEKDIELESDKVLIVMSGDCKIYDAFVLKLIKEITNSDTVGYTPPIENVVYVMDSLVDYDRAILICHLSGGYTPEMIENLSELSGVKLERKLKRIYRMLRRPHVLKYLIDPKEYAGIVKDSRGVPIELAEMGIPPKTLIHLANAGITRTVEIEGFSSDELQALPYMNRKRVEDLQIPLSAYNVCLKQEFL